MNEQSARSRHSNIHACRPRRGVEQTNAMAEFLRSLWPSYSLTVSNCFKTMETVILQGTRSYTFLYSLQIIGISRIMKKMKRIQEQKGTLGII